MFSFTNSKWILVEMVAMMFNAYIPHPKAYSIVIYDYKNDRSLEAKSNILATPRPSEIDIAGLRFNWQSEGVYALSLDPFLEDGYKTLYFKP